MIIAHCAAKRETRVGAGRREQGGNWEAGAEQAQEPGKFVALGISCSTRFKEIRDIFMGTCQIKSLPQTRVPSRSLPSPLCLLIVVALCRSVDNKSGHIILKFPARGLQCWVIKRNWGCISCQMDLHLDSPLAGTVLPLSLSLEGPWQSQSKTL